MPDHEIGDGLGRISGDHFKLAKAVLRAATQARSSQKAIKSPKNYYPIDLYMFYRWREEIK